MNKKLKILTVIFVCIIMAAAFAGCSNDGASGTEDSVSDGAGTETIEETLGGTEETEEATEQTEVEDYNIAGVVNESIKNCLPDEVDYTIEQIDSSCLQVVLKAAQETGNGGVVGTIMSFDEGSEEYKDFPDYKEIGTKDGKVYILMSPTDVQFDVTDAQQEADYTKLFDALGTLTIQ